MSPLEIDRPARTIAGRAIPWNTTSLVNHRLVALREGSLICPELVHLLIDHNRSLIVGRAIDWQTAPDGLHVTLLASCGARGDRALALAEAGWGLSCGFNLIDYTVSDAVWCDRGMVIEISLVKNPAFG